MKSIAFLMATPFTYGGEQRVVSKIANLFQNEGYNVSIICTANLKNIDHAIYNLNSNIKVEDASVTNIFDKALKKINNKVRKINSKTKFLSNCPNILKKFIFTKNIRNKIIDIINKNNYDYVVGIASDYSIFLASYRKKINSHTKIIGWQHNNFEAYFQKKGRRLYGEKKLFKKYVKNFDDYVVLMNDDKQKMDSYFNMKCTNIFNPLSFEKFVEPKLNQKKFIWFGRLEYAKGVDMLIEAYQQYKSLGGDWKLDLIGDGSEKPKIIDMVKQYQLEDDINFIGFTNEIEKYLLQSTIFLFPSRWEGFGLTLTESMQYGIPTICFDLNPFKEISEGFHSCYFVNQFHIEDFANAMIKLSKDEKTIREMSKEALMNARKFSGEKIIQDWIHMLSK